MANSEAKREEKRKKNKRKIRTSEEKERISKKTRIIHTDNSEKEQQSEDEAMEHQHGGVWDNLNLILSLQNKNLNNQRKVELTFDFISSIKLNQKSNEDFYADQALQTVSFSRLISFTIDWIQSRLVNESCLDFRCWAIFKFCVEECLKLSLPLNFTPNLLRALSSIVKNVLDKEDLFFSSEDYEYHSLLCECVVLLFSQRGRVFNAKMELWVSLVAPVVDLVRRIYSLNIAGNSVGTLLLRFSCLALDPFANFLRVQPNPKKIFDVFVDKLLEPLLSLLADLYLQTSGCNLIETVNLLNKVEDILSNGLFHPFHVDGFLTILAAGKNSASDFGKIKSSIADVKSYHRHFFRKLDLIMGGKVLALGGSGRLFHLFVVGVKKQKGVAVLSNVTDMTIETGISRPSENSDIGLMVKFSAERNKNVSEHTKSESMFAETNKSLFGLFVQFLEPLMLILKTYSENTLEDEQCLLHSLYSLISINKILASFMQEKIYVRTEDDSEGACLKFFKEIFHTVISFSAKLHSIWSLSLNKYDCKFVDTLSLLAKEIMNCLGYFLEIEYEVIESDLVSVWLIIFIYSDIYLSLRDTPEKQLLTSQILHLGSQLISIYRELRQVHKPIFALCKSIRLLGSMDKDNEIDYSFIPLKFSTSFGMRLQSVTVLFCAEEFRLALSNAIKSIPEGQVSGFIQQLKVDISDSFEWVNLDSPVDVVKGVGRSHLQSCSLSSACRQAEFFGILLSEIYTRVLDNSAVTAGNCILVGNSITDLMTLVKLKLGGLVGKQPDGVSEFLFTVTGRKLTNHKMPEGKNDISTLGPDTTWIFLFFFRLYMACRSLFRQTISLMPPDSSRKVSQSMGDLLTTYCGNDWMDEIDWKVGGYFSWIVEPSDSLLNTIHSVSDTCFADNIGDSAQLIYVLHAMALQRLVDLNKQLTAFEFLLEKAVRLAGMKAMNDAGSRPLRKEKKLFEKHISVLRQEAIDITDFLLRYLPVVEKSVQFISDINTKHEGKDAESFQDAWDLSVCSLSENSLPTAIWWILCQNTEIWCMHAAKKKLKKFLSILLQISSSFVSSSTCVGNQNIAGLHNLRVVTLHQISLELLSDTMFHEESFLCRHLISRFCRVFKKSVFSLFCDSFIGDVDLNSVPNWPDVLSKLEEIPAILNKGHHDNSGKEPGFLPHILFSTEKKKQLAVSLNLLSLLSWIPRGHMKMEDLSVLVTYIFNLERLVVLSLLHQYGESCMQEETGLLRLFVYSRKALKCLITNYCEEKFENGQSLHIPILCGSSSSILWFLKSVSAVVQLQHQCPGDHVRQVEHMIFSLMDHTSYLFLTLSKVQYRVAVSSLQINGVPQAELPISGDPNSKGNSINSDTSDAWTVVVLMAETLKKETQNLVFLLETKAPVAEIGIFHSVGNFTRLSSMISCFQGFLWGLASVLNETDQSCTQETKSFKWKLPHKLFVCIDEFEDFINCCLHAIGIEEHQQSGTSCGGHDLLLPNSGVSSENHEFGTRIKPSSRRKYDLESDSRDDCESKKRSETDVRSSKSRKKMSQLVDADIAINSLNAFDSFGRHQLNKPLLRKLLSGENPELAFLIRELFTASSAILKLRMKTGHRSKTESKIDCCISTSSSMEIFVWTSEFLLLEFAETVEPQPFSFVWLDGVIKYIEILGSYISVVDSTSSSNAYARLISMHLGAIGRCISLQKKRATLASHESESCTKTLEAKTGSSESTLGHAPSSLDEFKTRLRTSFVVLVQKPHLLIAMQALQRALVGVQEGSSIYDINTGIINGGKVSSVAAAGVECFDMVLESVSGWKCLDDVKSYTERLLGALFNIVLHLQGPLIFCGKAISVEGDTNPDPGSVILMCVEVLTKVAGKPSLFQMHSCHIGQSFRVPASLFENFLVLRSPQMPSNLFLDNSAPRPLAGACSYTLDVQFSVDLFAACSRLLRTVLRHHTRESARCISNLQISLCVLLHCLETVDTCSNGRGGSFTWKVQEGVKCAGFLRRIYEEIRQQKEVLKSYCFRFLSNYISVYSGNGPRKTGIKREIDEALRPGVYALMDACSTEDLNQLHIGFGEGACRNTLAALKRDYKQNFQYEGKV